MDILTIWRVMKRNLKKESLKVGTKTISFMDFVEACYKSKKREETMDFYYIKNKNDLKKQWDIIIQGVADNHVKLVEENKSFINKIIERVIKWINKTFSPL